MTDRNLADATYIEPITVDSVEQIIKKEKPDALLPTVGGQTALDIAVKIEKAGILKKYNVELIGANVDAIEKAEDREKFKNLMDSIGIETAKGGFVNSVEDAANMIDQISFPMIIRPSFTMGGTGGSCLLYTSPSPRD